MAWRMSGTYVATCSCQLICPCPTDNPPTDPDEFASEMAEGAPKGRV